MVDCYFFFAALAFFFLVFLAFFGFGAVFKNTPKTLLNAVAFVGSDFAMESSAKPFKGSYLKLARARRHIEELEREIASYLESIPVAFFSEVDTETGEFGASLRFRKCIPDEFSAIFGDCAHNMRAALDILANDAIAMENKQPFKVYFPFGRGPVHLEKEIKDKMGQASDALKDIVRSFKPYVGGNEVLRALHDLDITDKHVAILEAHASFDLRPEWRIVSERIVGDKIEGTMVADFSRVPVDQIDMTGFALNPRLKVRGRIIGPPPSLVIGPKLPLAGTEVIVALNQMFGTAECVLKTIEAYFLGDLPAGV